ncbi:MAG: TIGR03905 family TSCPD domain-containing protein [Bacteroidales bacterium]|nr:TIGR03905 family TSCPD domain-containing protein [Bacteroidales bacterium]
MQYRYKTQGTCSQEIMIEVENGIVKGTQFLGGCNGNLQGIGRLVEGMPMEEVVRRLSGVQCGMKGTSCPDQLARALTAIIEKEKNN